ncbi:serine hydrolase [Streptomyces sp. NPDC059851]|uniref:serine hydrolase n=1 Tax=Streptomyces sp. NPDC059851 TaxID=3346971 RepID=UPI0036534E7F
MKAMTVVGGSPDDPKVEGTTTAGAVPDDTTAEPDDADAIDAEDASALALSTADGTPKADADGELLRRGTDVPGDEPDEGAGAGGPEPARDTVQEKTGAGADGTTADDTAGTRPEAMDGADSRAEAARPGTQPEVEAEPEAVAADLGTDTDTDTGDTAADAEAKAGPKADDTQVLAMPAPTPAKPGSGTGTVGAGAVTSPAPKHTPDAEAGAESASDTGAPSEPDGAAGGDEPERGSQPTAGKGRDTGPEPDDVPASRTGTATEGGAEADGTLTLTKPTRDKGKAKAKAKAEAGAEPATRAAAPGDETGAGGGASAADSDGGGEDTRTVTLRAPDAATDPAGDDDEARRDAHEEAEPSVAAKDADGPQGRGSQSATATATATATGTKATADGDGDGRKVPAWARGEDGDTERTSRFVALKPLDEPTPAAPRSGPPSQPHASAAPEPPLDLLAQLTNTPPPPETFRRTALRRVKVWTPILLLLAGAYVGAQLLRPLPAPRLVAAETGRTVDGQFSIPWPAKGQGAVRVPGSGDIGSFGEQKPVATASVAKVMTAYVILKGHPLRKNDPGPDITVDAKAVVEGNSEDESRIQGLTAGTKFSQQDMLKMLMIPSANNVARLLARWDTGSDSETAFVEKMNAAARDLGMKDTTYTDPSGLDAGTVSTATDQLKLAEAVMKDEVFRSIVAMPSAPIKGLPEPLGNNNGLLSVQGLSVRGIKTGSSTPAGGALMWAAYKSVGDETPLIVGTLMEQRVEGPDLNAINSLALVQANSKKIIEAVRTALAATPLVRKGDTVGYVDDGLGGRTPLVATKDLNVIGVPGQQFKLTVAAAGAPPLPHEAKAGTEVGTLTAGEGEGAKSVPVAVRNALTEPSVGTRLTRLG